MLKDENFRNEVLEGNLLKVIFKLCLPLALYEVLHQIFNVADTLMASHISASAVSTVSYLVQFNNFIAALGAGIVVGSSIMMSQAYGEGNFKEVTKILSNSFIIVLFTSSLIIMLSPFSSLLMKISRTPSEFIKEGSLYFSITMISQALTFFNRLFISIEKTRGRSVEILIINTIQTVIKLGLTAFFVYALNGNIIHIGLASLISTSFITLYGLFVLLRETSIFTFKLKAIKFSSSFFKPFFALSLPSVLEKMLFSAGKAEVNNMAAEFGSSTVGAAGISNNMSGLITNWLSGFQDGGSALEGQLYGSKKISRGIKTYRYLQLISFSIATLGVIIFLFIKEPVATLFSQSRGGYNEEFKTMILSIYQYEMLGIILLSFCYPTQSLLYGMGKTKTLLVINLCRSVLFRIPIMYICSKVLSLGFISVGLAVAISNSLAGILSIIISEIILYKYKSKVYA